MEGVGDVIEQQKKVREERERNERRDGDEVERNDLREGDESDRRV